MIRNPNEVQVSVDLVQDALVHGVACAVVTSGPSPEARIIGVRLEDGWIALVYDRPVPDVWLRRECTCHAP